MNAQSQQQDVPVGTVSERTWSASRIYPGADHDYWVYVPAQYSDAEPACVMVFQDGQGYMDPAGAVRAPAVFDRLIHMGEMPVTIGVFVNPGRRGADYDLREKQYATIDDAYARFLLEEILAQVGKDCNLVDNAAGRAIAGMSDGGLCAFTVAWQRPDSFSKVVSHVGSFTRLRGGSEYPFLIRKTRGFPKPIRVFLQDGENDIDLAEGNWTLANLCMESALRYARYDYRFVLGEGGHDLSHGGAIFPDTLRWLWRDHPGVASAGKATDPQAVLGQWDVVTNNTAGQVRHGVLNVVEKDGALAATLVDDTDGAIEVTAIAFEDDVLSWEYRTPPSQMNWGKGSSGTMKAWLKVDGDAFKGALSDGAPDGTRGPVVDFPVKGRRSSAVPAAGST